MISSRRKSRELALQMLFQLEFSKVPLEEAIKNFFPIEDAAKDTKEFCLSIVKGVLEHQKEIDIHIKSVSKNWKMERMNTVDKNVIRIGVYELLYGNDIPENVAINEAIEIAKKYGSYGSGSFVNGILDAIKTQWKKKN